MTPHGISLLPPEFTAPQLLGSVEPPRQIAAGMRFKWWWLCLGGDKARLCTLQTPLSPSLHHPPPPATGGQPGSALWVLSEGDGMRVCKCRRAFVSGFHRGQSSSDVMSAVYEAAESLGSCSLSLNSKINMYLPHTPRPQATCTRFPVIYPPPAAHYTRRASTGGIETNILLYLPRGWKPQRALNYNK